MKENKIDLKKLHNTETEIMEEITRICRLKKLTYFLIGGTLLGAVRHKGFIPWDDDLDIAMPREDFEIFINECRENLKPKFELDYINTNNKYWLPFAKVRNRNTIYQENIQKKNNQKMGMWVDIFPLDYTNDCEGKSLQKREKHIKKLKGILYLKNLREITPEDNFIKRVGISVLQIIPNRFLHYLINKLMKGKGNNKNKYFVNFGSQYGIKKQTHLKDKYFPAIDVEFEGKMYKAPRDYDYVLTKIYGKNYMELPPIEKRVTHNPIRIKFENEPEINFEK